jgi:hypothetical protein
MISIGDKVISPGNCFVVCYLATYILERNGNSIIG